MLLFIEDDLTIAKYTIELLNLKKETLHHAPDMAGALHCIQNRLQDFELILLDIMLPDGSGLDILKAVREVSQIPVIITSAVSQEAEMISALNNGADDYLVKPFRPDLLLAKINAFRRRNSPGENPEFYIKKNGDVIKIDPASRKITLNDSHVSLTSNEFDIMELLLKRRGSVLSKQNIYECTKGKKMSQGERVIDVYIGKLRNKFELSGELKTVWGKGYLLCHENISENNTHISN